MLIGEIINTIHYGLPIDSEENISKIEERLKQKFDENQEEAADYIRDFTDELKLEQGITGLKRDKEKKPISIFVTFDPETIYFRKRCNDIPTVNLFDDIIKKTEKLNSYLAGAKNVVTDKKINIRLRKSRINQYKQAFEGIKRSLDKRNMKIRRTKISEDVGGYIEIAPYNEDIKKVLFDNQPLKGPFYCLEIDYS